MREWATDQKKDTGPVPPKRKTRRNCRHNGQYFPLLLASTGSPFQVTRWAPLGPGSRLVCESRIRRPGGPESRVLRGPLGLQPDR